MNLTALKTKLGVEQLDLSFQKNDKGERAIDPKTNAPTQWLRHWDNDSRRAIVMHEDVAKLIKSKPELATLALKEKGMQTPQDASKPPYDLVVVVNYTEGDYTF